MQLVRKEDSPIGYPHRPPCLRLENRRTSISVDDVIRRTNLDSGASSPDSNLLRVQANLPGRRHSDNTIQLPRIQVNSQSPPGSSMGYSRRSSAGNASARRHSAGPNVGMYGNMPCFGFPGFPGYKNVAMGNNNIDFVIPSYQQQQQQMMRTSPTPGMGRRFSAAPAFGSPVHPSLLMNQQQQQPPSNILQQIGTGMVSPHESWLPLSILLLNISSKLTSFFSFLLNVHHALSQQQLFGK